METEWLALEKVQVPAPPFLEGLRIALLSDFHLYPHTRIELIQAAVEQTLDLKPDLIALTGDFVQERADAIFELAPVLARMNARHGIFCVLGNHDHWKGAEVVMQGLTEAGLEVLDNRGVQIDHGGSTFYLAGVDDVWSGRPDLQAALAGHQQDDPIILLSHAPDPADDYCQDRRICLQLSGHSHGGQVRIPFFGSPFLPPYGRKYDLGLYRIHDAWLYTNRGIGVTVPIRLNCRPEVTEITLVRP